MARKLLPASTMIMPHMPNLRRNSSYIENSGKIMGRNVGNSGLDNKTGQITHGGEQVSVAAVVSEGTRCPAQVNVQDKEGAGDGPGEDELFVLTSLFVR
jgi:hypothetical protein